MQKLGVPYTNADIDAAAANEEKQANTIVQDLAKNGVKAKWDSDMVALIAYLQRLGRTRACRSPT